MHNGTQSLIRGLLINKPIFSAGKYICLIINQKVLIYEVYSTVFIYLRTETLESLFGIADTKVKSAFNHYKGDCVSNKDICAKTTLIISPSKHYEITWTKRVCKFNIFIFAENTQFYKLYFYFLELNINDE